MASSPKTLAARLAQYESNSQTAFSQEDVERIVAEFVDTAAAVGGSAEGASGPPVKQDLLELIEEPFDSIFRTARRAAWKDSPSEFYERLHERYQHWQRVLPAGFTELEPRLLGMYEVADDRPQPPISWNKSILFAALASILPAGAILVVLVGERLSCTAFFTGAQICEPDNTVALAITFSILVFGFLVVAVGGLRGSAGALRFGLSLVALWLNPTALLLLINL